MSGLTRCVRFARSGDGSVSVSAPPDLQPIDEFLETDLGESPAERRLVAEHARDPGPDPWGFGGDSCHITVRPETVLVENDFDGRRVTVPRTEFVRILGDFERALAGR